MDDYFDLMRDQFVRACNKGAHRPWWRRGADSKRVGRLLIVAASTTLVAVVVLAAFGIGGVRRASNPPGSGPRLTPAQQNRVDGLVNRIVVPVNRRCEHVRPLWHESISYGAPDRAILATLGVLRQQATAADSFRPFQHTPILNVAHGIYIRYVRLARTYRGTRYYVIPAANTASLDAHCIAENRRALRQALPHIPAALRPAVERRVDQILLQAGPHEGIFLVFRGPGRQGGGETAASLIQDIRQEGGDFEIGGDGGPTWQLSGIIPDGVASVTIEFPTQSGRLLAVTARPVANVLVTQLTRQIRGPATMIWRASDGHVMRVIRKAPL